MSEITSKIKTVLSNAFNKAARHKIVDGREVAFVRGGFGRDGMMLPYLDFRQPPVDFEKRTGMSGLSCQYFLPPDLLPRELQEYGMISLADNRVAHERLSEVWGHLKNCNPETLGRLEFDAKDTMKLYHAILGAASAFLPQDIQAWLDGWNGVTLRENREAELLINKIEVCHGPAYWVPSMETLRMMDKQLVSVKKPAIKPSPVTNYISANDLAEITDQLLTRIKAIVKKNRPI